MPEYLTLTNIITLITCWVSYSAFNKPRMMNQLIFYPALIKERKEFSRFLSSGFIHGSFIHLAFNMIAFWSFGNNVEIIFKMVFGLGLGSVLYLGLYFLGMLAAHLPDYIKHQDNPSYRALGASGAVSAVVFANILFDPWSNLYLFMAIPLPQVLAGIGFLWYSSHMANKGSHDGIGHNAHLYGALFGLLFTTALHPEFFLNFIDCTLNYNQNCIRDYLMNNY